MNLQRFDVINFHLTEHCNYRCSYCYAKFDNQYELKLEGWKKAVDKICEYFKRNKIVNGRINLAGGEPLLLNFLDDLINYIYLNGIKISIITNASLLTKNKVDTWIGKMDMLGVSVDSLDYQTNFNIGRIMGSKVLDLKRLIDVLNYAKEQGMKLKVNTVVSNYNLDQDIMPLYEKVSFDRIKLMQVRIQNNCNEKAKPDEITSEQFMNYTKKITSLNKNIVIEPEHDLESSYIIIDPHGNLVSNQNNYHQKVGSIFDESLEQLIAKAGINYETFSKRYILPQGE
jgi:radical S-adenosyl methionine domain-containing protein 2